MTDRQADGIAIASTALAMRALWCAVKTALGKEKLANCFTLTILCRINKLLSYPSQTAHRTDTTKILQNSTYIKTATAHLAEEKMNEQTAPFPSNRHHKSNGDCLEGKRENYQVSSVQYYVQQLYTVHCTHI